jgi:peptidoglycan hydrolase-like protein with peptidoglycan-binding domain
MTAPAFTRILRADLPYMRGPDVLELQRQFLKDPRCHAGSPDGIFGPATVAAVKAWQTLQGLQPDGVVTEAMWRQIFADS